MPVNLVFEAQTASPSTKAIRPAPLRASASAAHEPTPPSPTTTKADRASRSAAARP